MLIIRLRHKKINLKCKCKENLSDFHWPQCDILGAEVLRQTQPQIRLFKLKRNAEIISKRLRDRIIPSETTISSVESISNRLKRAKEAIIQIAKENIVQQ